MEFHNFGNERRTIIHHQAPPGGESHFNISDSGYGDRDIYHPYKRNNHPNNDINPPPNANKKDNEIENANGATPVTGTRPSIRPRAPPGGFSNDIFGVKPVTEKPEKFNKRQYKSQFSHSPFGFREDPKKEVVEEIKQNVMNVEKNVKKLEVIEKNEKIEEVTEKLEEVKEVITKLSLEEQQEKNQKNNEQEPITETQQPINTKPTYNKTPFTTSNIFSDEPVIQKPSIRIHQNFNRNQESTGEEKVRVSRKRNLNNPATTSNINSDSVTGSRPVFATSKETPGGSSSITFGTDNTPPPAVNSFSGRRRNYANNHFASSFTLG